MEPLRLPAIRPRELLVVAGTGGRPTASSTGKLTKVPETTTEMMPPAANPAAAADTISHPVMRSSPSSLTRRPAHARLGTRWHRSHPAAPDVAFPKERRQGRRLAQVIPGDAGDSVRRA